MVIKATQRFGLFARFELRNSIWISYQLIWPIRAQKNFFLPRFQANSFHIFASLPKLELVLLCILHPAALSLMVKKEKKTLWERQISDAWSFTQSSRSQPWCHASGRASVISVKGAVCLKDVGWFLTMIFLPWNQRVCLKRSWRMCSCWLHGVCFGSCLKGIHWGIWGFLFNCFLGFRLRQAGILWRRSCDVDPPWKKLWVS